MYDSNEVNEMCAVTDIREFIPGLKGTGEHQYTTCPFCGKEGKKFGTFRPKGSMYVTMAKCFSCGEVMNSAVKAVMHYESKSFPEAVAEVAERTNYMIETEEEKERKRKKAEIASQPKKRRTKKEAFKSFCEKQLEGSGLTVADVTAKVLDRDGNEVEVPTFVKGGYDTRSWEYNLHDDEMLIFYYGLDGHLEQYASRGIAGRKKDYVRVRWSNPDLHKSIKGDSVKYQSPLNAPCKLYFPQLIRSYYQTATTIDTLILQEGEKKAEKACKHGIPSIAIQGINNIGNKETGIIQELQYLIQRCGIKKVVLLFDSDWNHLSKNIAANDSADKRPRSFAGAAKKFRNYVESMQNVNVNVDVYFGHIKENEADDKGIDDLLCNTLKGKEETLGADIRVAMTSHDGEGVYTSIHKISTLSDYQIDEFWLLRSPEKFYEFHKERLDKIGKFRLNRISYIIEDEKLKVATKYESENELWKTDYDKNGKKVVTFTNRELLKFIAANGFYRVHTTECEDDGYRFIHIEDGIIKFSGINEIRNFVYNYLEDNCKDEDVKEYFSAKIDYVLSPGKLSLLKMVDDNFEQFEQNVQHFYYENGAVDVNADTITMAESHATVWQDKIIKRTFVRRPIFKSIWKDDEGAFHYTLTEDGAKCEFLKFLLNVSNFWNDADYMGAEETKQYACHVVNKITTLGYLLNDFKFQTELKAVIAMDGQMGDIGQSNGRTGKSLIGMAVMQMLEQTKIDGRNTKNDDDFLYSSVTPRTRNIFLDDVKVNFDFGRFFFAITGDLNVNPKGASRYVIKQEKSPKFYITTNHAINATDRSSMERIAFMSFSDYYNDSHRPVDEFGHAFFTDWDDEQWCLFDNLMCECNMYYHQSMAKGWYRVGQGAVPPPMEDIMQRTLLQQMGSSFHQWAETYFDPEAGHLNQRLKRKELYDAYHAEFPDSKFGVTANNFKTKLELYCKFKKYDLNARKKTARGLNFFDFISKNHEDVFIGGMDKSSGIEYFTVSQRETSKNGVL